MPQRGAAGAGGAPTPLRQIAGLFLRLGVSAFGGPAAHIALMQREVVERRGWLSREQFLDYLGATNLIPGPNSTELAIHIGHARGGARGLVVAGACFILPAALMVTGLAWAYARFGSLPAVRGPLHGMQAVVIAVVAQALWRLLRSAVRNPWHAALSAGALAATWLGLHELLVLAGCGALAALGARRGAGSGSPPAAPPREPRAGVAGGAGSAEVRPDAAGPPRAGRLARLAAGLPGAAAAGPAWAGAALAVPAAAAPFGLGPLFLVFVKIGAVLFGSGYVLLAFLRADLVQRLHWLTERQLLDAIAVGQFTPGPVFTTATFVGYLLGGARGAAVATAGIFLPAFLFVAVSGPLVPRMRRSRLAGAVLDGVNVGSLALMAFVTLILARVAVADPAGAALALASLLALVVFRLNPAWLIAAGAAVGAAVWR